MKFLSTVWYLWAFPMQNSVSLSCLLITALTSLQGTAFPSHTVLEGVGNWWERHFTYQSTELLIPAVQPRTLLTLICSQEGM